MSNSYLWDERIEDFMSVLYHKNVRNSSFISIKPIPTNKIFLNISLLSNLIILFFFGEDEITMENDDIFKQLKHMAKGTVNQSIINIEFDQQINNFQPIKKLLLEYLTIQKDKRSAHITNLVKKCNLFFENLLNSEIKIHLIPFTVTFAIVHLTVLREDLKLNPQNFGNNKLHQTISRYRNHFTNSFRQFFMWRMDQINTSTSISLDATSFFALQANGEVEDIISNKMVTYFAASSNDQIFTKVFDLIKLRMFNEAKAEFIKMFLHIFSLVNFITDHKISWPSDISSFWIGPYGIDTFPDGRHNFDENSKLFYNISKDESGVITKIELKTGTIVDRIQVFYENGRVGKTIGTGSGGSLRTISNLNKISKYIIAVNLKFGHGLLSDIEFIFNDGKSTGSIKNRNNESTIQIGPFGKHNEFRLSGMIGGGGKARDFDAGENVAHIAFQFRHVDFVQE